jgi:hypothetical protein
MFQLIRLLKGRVVLIRGKIKKMATAFNNPNPAPFFGLLFSSLGFLLLNMVQKRCVDKIAAVFKTNSLSSGKQGMIL